MIPIAPWRSSKDEGCGCGAAIGGCFPGELPKGERSRLAFEVRHKKPLHPGEGAGWRCREAALIETALRVRGAPRGGWVEEGEPRRVVPCR